MSASFGWADAVWSGSDWWIAVSIVALPHLHNYNSNGSQHIHTHNSHFLIVTPLVAFIITFSIWHILHWFISSFLLISFCLPSFVSFLASLHHFIFTLFLFCRLINTDKLLITLRAAEREATWSNQQCDHCHPKQKAGVSSVFISNREKRWRGWRDDEVTPSLIGCCQLYHCTSALILCSSVSLLMDGWMDVWLR